MNAVLEAARAKWKDNWRFLGIDEVTLDTLRGSDSNYLYEVLKHRVYVYKPGEENSQKRTWRTLLGALRTRAINEKEKANELEKGKYLDTDPLETIGTLFETQNYYVVILPQGTSTLCCVPHPPSLFSCTIIYQEGLGTRLIKSNEEGANDHLQEMLSDWLKQVGPSSSWTALIKAQEENM